MIHGTQVRRQQEITNDGIILARLLYLLLPENTEMCAFLFSNILHVNEPYICYECCTPPSLSIE
jgi:hypothetical protein